VQWKSVPQEFMLLIQISKNCPEKTLSLVGVKPANLVTLKAPQSWENFF
jgi:hypothetical protein